MCTVQEIQKVKIRDVVRATLVVTCAMLMFYSDAECKMSSLLLLVSCLFVLERRFFPSFWLLVLATVPLPDTRYLASPRTVPGTGIQFLLLANIFNTTTVVVVKYIKKHVTVSILDYWRHQYQVLQQCSVPIPGIDSYINIYLKKYTGNIPLEKRNHY